MKNLLLFFALSIPLINCSSNDEEGIKDSRDDYMIELQQAFDENNIPYKVDSDGYIRYSGKHKDSVEKIIKKIDEDMIRLIGTKFEDKSSTEYFRKLLDERHINYTTEIKNNEDWTYWQPQNNAQEEKILMEVVSHSFRNQ